MLVVGSRAARVWLPNFREPKDWDVIATFQEISAWADAQGDRLVSLVPSSEGRKMKATLADGVWVEFEPVELSPSGAMLHAMTHTGRIDFLGVEARIPSPTALYLIKRSHIHRPIHWRKNIADLHALKAIAGEPDDHLRAFFQTRQAETDARQPTRTHSLEMSNSDFFRQTRLAVEIVHPHDVYHWAVAYEDAPLFTRIKRDQSLARCERDLFEALSLERRLRCVREETMVIALERYIIPGRIAREDAAEAYHLALERVSTTLTSGWFRAFAIEHYPLLKEPDVDFVALFLERLDQARERVAAGGSGAVAA